MTDLRHPPTVPAVRGRTITSRRLPSRRSFLQVTAMAAASLAVGQFRRPPAVVADEPGPLTAEEALARLLDGNRRFALGEAEHPEQSPARLRAVAAGQHPFAFVLGCYDSRVSHELVFDQGLGDVFSSRTAGNLLDDAILGGIEFGVEEFHVPLVLILGHQRCGAVTAALNAITTGSEAPGMIGQVVEALRPAVELAQSRPGDAVDNAVRANVELGVARLQGSPVIAEAMEQQGLKVVGGYYSLDTGLVELIA